MPDDTNVALWSKTPPTEQGWYWWRPGPERRDRTPEIVLIKFIDSGELVMLRAGMKAALRLHGEWSSRIDLPIAAPVECVGLVDGDGVVRKWVREGARSGYQNSKVIRGVFVPLAEEPSDAG